MARERRRALPLRQPQPLQQPPTSRTKLALRLRSLRLAQRPQSRTSLQLRQLVPKSLNRAFDQSLSPTPFAYPRLNQSTASHIRADGAKARKGVDPPEKCGSGWRRGSKVRRRIPRSCGSRAPRNPGVRPRFIQPGEPIQNAFVENFIGRFRDECLNQHWFGSLAEAARVDRGLATSTTTASARTSASAKSRRSASSAGSACPCYDADGSLHPGSNFRGSSLERYNSPS
jgi:hypothetical protein